MDCPLCGSKGFASDSRAIKRPLGNELDDATANRLGPGRRRNYDCSSGHRFTTYELHREELLAAAEDSRDLRDLRRILSTKKAASSHQ